MSIIKLGNGIYKMSFGTPENISPVKTLNPASKWDVINHLTENPCPFSLSDIFYTQSKRGVLLEIPLEQGEEVYGLGLQLKSFRQTAHKKMLRVNSDPAADTGDSHAPVPFYVTSNGYGVLIDTARYATFYAGNIKKVGGKQDLEGFNSADNPGMWWQIKDGSGNMMVEIPIAQGIDIYIFSGENIKDAVARYNLFNGGGPKIPIWGLGILYRGYMHANSKHIRSLAKSLRDDNLPCDIFGLEPGWQTHSYSCTYMWDPERFPDHKELINDLNDSGFKLNLWEHAYVHPTSPVFDEIALYSGDNYVWDGRIPDFTLPEGEKVFMKTQEPLIDEGVSGFKLDECDNSDFLSNWGFPDYTNFPGGADGEQMHSLFGVLYQRSLLKAYNKRNQLTMGQVRSSGACATSYPFVLYSDLYNHSDFIRGMGSAAFSGLLWSPEVRQAESEDELLRRIAGVIASPQALLNCFMIPSPPWKQFDLEKNLAGEFLENSDELTAKVRVLFELRMKLVPHLYTAFCDYENHGIPPVRPVVFDYPEDKNTKDIWDEFILGEGLLAAPVIWGQHEQGGRNIYLPSGTWYDFYSNEIFEGEKTFYYEATPEKLPLFVKKGTTLALAEPQQFLDNSADKVKFDITLHIYGESEGCKLYSPIDKVSDIPKQFLANEQGIEENPYYFLNNVKKIF